MQCFSDPGPHPAHDWTYGGQRVRCDGTADVRECRRLADREARQGVPDGQCCADPLCGCTVKPGWGGYAAPERRLS